MARRASTHGACALLALALLAPGCAAYDGRYWSFPLNSQQMLENAAHYKWTYGKALGAEFAFQIFPWTWIASLADLLVFPFSGPHDLYIAVADTSPPEPFEDQIHEHEHHKIVPMETKEAVGPAVGAKVEKDATPLDATR